MKLLLDTHIWLWSLREPKRVVRRNLQALDDASNEVWLSPISTWEALILHRKGKIQLHSDPALWVAQNTAQLREAPLTHEIVLVSEQLQLPHADPADRFLAATAKVLGLTLVTADQNLLSFSGISTWANR